MGKYDHEVNVHCVAYQLSSKAHSGMEQSFLNIRNDIYGAVGVWGCVTGHNIVLMKSKSGSDFHLIQFDNQECYDEWFESFVNKDNYIIKTIEDIFE